MSGVNSALHKGQAHCPFGDWFEFVWQHPLVFLLSPQRITLAFVACAMTASRFDTATGSVSFGHSWHKALHPTQKPPVEAWPRAVIGIDCGLALQLDKGGSTMGFLNGHLKMPPNWGRNAQKKHEHSCTRNFTGKSRPERRKNALDRV